MLTPQSPNVPHDNDNKTAYVIDDQRYRATQAVNSRIRFLILHFTTLDFAQSVTALTGPRVSSHYLIPAQADASYRTAGFDKIRIFQMVDEQQRAWHAGESYWGGRIHLNDSAIGIEIVNGGHATPPEYYFPPFEPAQIEATIQLCRGILARYPDITPTHVLGHSDIAIGRKFDPGPMFAWQQLHAAGIGAWFDQTTAQQYLEQFTTHLPSQPEIIRRLAAYGYDVRQAHDLPGWQHLIRAVQLHFRPSCYDGVLDAETAAIIFALTDRYCPAAN